MKTLHIEGIFRDYLKKEQTQYALLINGTWGSGKTFFWKNTLIALANKDEKVPLYISLNGVKTIEHLQQMMLVKLIPVIRKSENKALNNVIRLAGNILNTGAKMIRVDSSTLFSGLTLDGLSFKDKIFCFDDFERCRIPVKELLGFINDFVEHRNLKCLILADEDKIIKSTKGKVYSKVKEKVISRVLNYEPNLVEVLPALMKAYEGQKEYYDFLEQYKDYIFDFLSEYKEYNLRIISFFFETLNKIYPYQTDVKSELQQEVILHTALVSIEFKRGKLTSKDSEDYKGLKNVNNLMFLRSPEKKSSPINFFNLKNEDNKKPKPTYAEKFHRKYLTNRINEYHFYETIYKYILSGYLDVDSLKKELKGRLPEKHPEEIEELQRLAVYDFRSMQSKDFDYLTEKVLQNAAQGMYSIYDYERLSNFYHYYRKNNLIDLTKEEINKTLIKGLEIATQRKELDYKIFDNIKAFGVSMPEMQPVRDRIIELHNAIHEEKRIEKSVLLIDTIKKCDSEELSQFFENNENTSDLMEYVDGKDLFQALENISNKMLSLFTRLIAERYKGEKLKYRYPNDYGCLKNLKKTIDGYITQKNNLAKLRKFNWIELLNQINNAISDWDGTKGQ